MKYIIILMSLLLCGTLYADTQFNPYSGEWETAPAGSQPRYNAMSGEWSCQPQGAVVEYNPYNDKWQWDSGHNPESEE